MKYNNNNILFTCSSSNFSNKNTPFVFVFICLFTKHITYTCYTICLSDFYKGRYIIRISSYVFRGNFNPQFGIRKGGDNIYIGHSMVSKRNIQYMHCKCSQNSLKQKQWCNGQRARLECCISWFSAPVESNEGLYSSFKE